MKYILYLMIGITLSNHVYGQCGDRVAEVVNLVGEKFEAGKAYSVNFSISMNYVGEPATTQRGKITVKGNQFFLKMPEQQFISDGQTLWIYMPKEKEVQIMPVADQAEWANLSPIALLKQYCSNDFLSQSLGLAVEDGQEVEHLEFTPNDKDQDVFKVRISYLPNTQEVSRIKTFNKDGSRITIDASEYQYNQTIPTGLFSFNTTELNDVHIEDLR